MALLAGLSPSVVVVCGRAAVQTAPLLLQVQETLPAAQAVPGASAPTRSTGRVTAVTHTAAAVPKVAGTHIHIPTSSGTLELLFCLLSFQVIIAWIHLFIL